MPLPQEKIKEVLNSVIDPSTGKGLAESGEVEKIQLLGADLKVEIVLGYAGKSLIPALAAAAAKALDEAGYPDATVEVRQEIKAHKVQPLLRRIPGVKNIIAISSGKGGVGKSTVTANFALALAAEGARVGVLDADIYGPSQPAMLGVSGTPACEDGEHMTPNEAYGMQVNSIGFLIDEEDPVIWRGPMVSSALQQLLFQTQWKDLDYLVIDLPPGTGDVQLTLTQQVPVTGAIVVTTPQDIATLDAKKGLMMFRKVNVPVLGIVENMALFRCPHCGHLEHVFGEGGAERMSAQYNVPVLGSLPLEAKIREEADSGRPTVASDPEGETAKMFRAIARLASAAVSQLPLDHSASIPKIKPVQG